MGSLDDSSLIGESDLRFSDWSLVRRRGGDIGSLEHVAVGCMRGVCDIVNASVPPFAHVMLLS